MEQQQQGESAVAAEKALKRRHVHKFGGSSLADPVCYRRVASILEQQAEQQAGGRADEGRLYVHPGANESRDRALSRTVKIQPELDDDAKQHEPARVATIADILHGPPHE